MKTFLLVLSIALAGVTFVPTAQAVDYCTQVTHSIYGCPQAVCYGWNRQTGECRVGVGTFEPCPRWGGCCWNCPPPPQDASPRLLLLA